MGGGGGTGYDLGSYAQDMGTSGTFEGAMTSGGSGVGSGFSLGGTGGSSTTNWAALVPVLARMLNIGGAGQVGFGGSFPHTTAQIQSGATPPLQFGSPPAAVPSPAERLALVMRTIHG